MGLFYKYCKWNTRLLSHIYYKNIRVSGIENLPQEGPVLLAANHPNSFLDAVLIGAALPRDTHFLARGDAFSNKTAAKVLGSLNMLPVYRLSEGKENLNKNTETFDACQNILEKNEIVLIFAEGLSENNWDLRSLKKGPARIAKKAWNSDNDAQNLAIVPVGITYEHYQGEGKNILINFGKAYTSDDLNYQKNEALFVKELNERLSHDFEKLAYIDRELTEDSEEHRKFTNQFNQLNNSEINGLEIVQKLSSKKQKPAPKKGASFIQLSLIFWPYYLLCSSLAPKIVKQKIFQDSIRFGLFIFLWPIYLLLLAGLVQALVSL
ncbi:MAG: 1-acyl-sn-glycerol-3-phosphate acyltransferase [Bacteroidia bacterium]|nr:1-acyl-sn-glycerol-3-phosphate acyltransferase [Bacteroidia bacterium]